MKRIGFKGLVAGATILVAVVLSGVFALQAWPSSQAAQVTKKPKKPAPVTVVVTPALVAKGKAIVKAKGCGGCHTITGAKSTGPTWKGLAGSKVHLTTGKTIVATDAYLIGVITDPTTLQVEGYDASIMTEMIPPGSVSTAQAKEIVAYIKTLKK